MNPKYADINSKYSDADFRKYCFYLREEFHSKIRTTYPSKTIYMLERIIADNYGYTKSNHHTVHATYLAMMQLLGSGILSLDEFIDAKLMSEKIKLL